MPARTAARVAVVASVAGFVLAACTPAPVEGVIHSGYDRNSRVVYFDATKSAEIAAAALGNGVFELGVDRAAESWRPRECLAARYLDGATIWSEWTTVATDVGVVACS